MDSAEKLRLALLRILNANNLKLFGCIIYNFIIEMIDTGPILNSIREQIKVRPNIKPEEVQPILDSITDSFTAFATFKNNKPFIGLYSCFIDSKTVDELIFVILHEILHVLDGHHYRTGSRDPWIYNLAGDHVINTTLKRDIDSKDLTKVAAPKEMFIVPELLNKEGMTTSEVYDYLNQKLQITNKQTFSTGNGNGEGEDGSGQIQIADVNINGKKRTVVKDINQSPTESKEQIAESTETLKSEVRAILNTPQIGRGLVGGSLKNLIDKIIEVEIPWYKLLERVLLTKIVPAPDNRTWLRPLKRLRAHGILLPGSGTSKKASIGCIMIDTSGSISDKDLQMFTSVVLQSLTYFDEIWIIKHDVPVRQEKRIKSSEANHDDFIYQYKGRGGTSHTDAFKLVEKAVIEKKELIGIVIMLTDFESNIQDLWSTMQWVKKIPVSIVLTRDCSVPNYIDPHPILIKAAK